MFYGVSLNIKDSSSKVIAWERHSLNLVYTLIYMLCNNTRTVYMICNSKRVSMNFSGSLQENSLSTVWWEEVLKLLLHGMLVCQRPQSHFWKSTTNAWSWEAHKNYFLFYYSYYSYTLLTRFKLFAVQMLQTCFHTHTSLPNFFNW